MKLDFVVPGFSKCGTTTLCALLNEHPQLFIPEVKELNFFAWKWHLGWEWYSRHFAQADNNCLNGEGGQGYASAEYAECSAARLQEHFPDVKLIFLARNPVRRLASSYREMHHNGHVYGVHPPFSISETLRSLPNMIHDTQYWKCINVFRKYFHDDQIHVAFSEDFMRSPATTLSECFDFLGVDTRVSVENPDRNLNSASEKLYDTTVMRFIRTNPSRNRMWQLLKPATRNRIEKTFGLRRPFEGRVQWDSDSLELVREHIMADAVQFLDFYGKPLDFWDFEVQAPHAAVA